MPPRNRFGRNYGPGSAGMPNAGGYNAGGGYGGAQNPQPIAGGNGVQYTQDFFTYVVGPLTSIDHGITVNQSITIQADSDFEWRMSTVSANLDGNAAPWTDALIIPISILITDGGSGRQLQSAGVPITGIAGTGKQPFILPVYRIFKSKSTVNFAFTNYSSADKYDNLFLNLIGRKIFKMGGPG